MKPEGITANQARTRKAELAFCAFCSFRVLCVPCARRFLCALCILCGSFLVRSLPVFFLIGLLGSASAQPQPGQLQPHLGYLYPAGGQQGTTVRITAGGQFLRGVTDVYVTGADVNASVVKYYRPVRNINKEQREELIERMRAARDNAVSELPPRARAALEQRKSEAMNTRDATGKPAAPGRDASSTKQAGAKSAAFKPIEHPVLEGLESKNLRELAHVAHTLFFPRWKKQPNAQIDETVLIEITIDPDAVPGDREIRLATPLGLTEPMLFEVSQLPEVTELEPNDPNGDNRLPFNNPNEISRLPRPAPIELPALLNGQIMPGDVDRFPVHARKGQKIVVETQARHLVPYLPDAVPGWFQAVVTLFDDKGKEVAYADDFQYNPDPILYYEIPEDGTYEIEVRDAIYRGREDFVYRIAVGELPFVSGVVPLGGPTGKKTTAHVEGWNLSENTIRLDTRPGTADAQQTIFLQGKLLSNPVTYVVGTLPETGEIEPNETRENSQFLAMPCIVNGVIGQPGDVDVFRFEGRAGDPIVAEIVARRLRSPLDSLLRLFDESGRVVAWNDDHEDPAAGLVTHHADSCLSTRLPANGIYALQVADAQQRGGSTFAYRLRLGPPQPDFALRMTPSSLGLLPGRAVPFTVHALRTDGFEGDIELILKGAPSGYVLSGGRIPAGRDSVRVTLQIPWRAAEGRVTFQVEGRARINGETIAHTAVPADNRMQAFAYRHLVPAQELVAIVSRARRPLPPVQLADDTPVRIPAGGATRVRMRIPPRAPIRDILLELNEPPKGLTIRDVAVVPGSLTFRLQAGDDAPEPGFADNLIVDAYLETTGVRPGQRAPNRPNARPASQTNPAGQQPKTADTSSRPKQKVPLGVLPAIPFEIVQP